MLEDVLKSWIREQYNLIHPAIQQWLRRTLGLCGLCYIFPRMSGTLVLPCHRKMSRRLNNRRPREGNLSGFDAAAVSVENGPLATLNAPQGPVIAVGPFKKT